MAEPKLELDNRLNRLEAAIGTLADSLDYGDIVRAILYGGGASREEGAVTPEELDRAHVIAKAFHEAYERLAPQYRYKTQEASAVPWEDVPQQNKMLMTAVISELLDSGVIRDRKMVDYPE